DEPCAFGARAQACREARQNAGARHRSGPRAPREHQHLERGWSLGFAPSSASRHTRSPGSAPWSCVPASLATDPVERVVVVMKHRAALEAPLPAVLFDQLARVAAGRKAAVIAVL